MARTPSRKLFPLAGALIAAGMQAGCDGNETRSYEVRDRGLKMAEPKLAAREKCYGIAPAQYNDCATLKLNDCAGTAEEDYLPDKWKYVAAGSCETQGGKMEPPEEPYQSEK